MSKILRRPMFRGGGKVSSYGNGIATGLGYSNGGRAGYAGGGQIGGGEIYGKRFSDGRYGFAKPSAYVEGYNRIYGSGTGSGARTASTGAGIVESAAAKQGLRSPNFFTRQLVNARNIPYLGRVVNPLLKLGTAGITGTASALATAGAAGYGAGSIADYVTKSGDTPEAYAYRKEASEANPFLFDETSSAGEEAYINEQGELIQGDELDTFTRELTQKDQGEKYGFMPRGGKAQRLIDLGLDKMYDSKTGKRIEEVEEKKTTTTTNNLNGMKDTTTTEITDEDYLSMLGGDKAKRRDVGDMLSRFSALALKRGRPGEGKRTLTDIASDVMAAEAGAGPSRLERLEEKVGDYKIKDRMDSKRNKEAIELMKANVDYQKKKDIYEIMEGQMRGGATKKEQLFVALQKTEGTIPKTITDRSIVSLEKLTEDQIGKVYILEEKNNKNVTTYTAIKIVTDQNGNPITKVILQR
tara:strand:- start:4608 stop:6011 length:1404 start_codon:yes stop_codon:yes gene_type:complete